jgi:hypothetical protein
MTTAAEMVQLYTKAATAAAKAAGKRTTHSLASFN